MPRSVLVTRPQPGASRTAAHLATLGFRPLLLPLSETVTVPVDTTTIPDNLAAIAVTSAAALRHAPDALLQRLESLPCFSVGGATAEAANEAGFTFVLEGPGDASGLAAVLIERGIAGRMAYLCGHIRRPEFEQKLAKAGIAVTVIETYDTERLDVTDAGADAILAGRPVDAALVYSAAAAEALASLAARPALKDSFAGTEFCCLSARIAEALKSAVRGKIRIAPEPTEAALLSLIAQA